MTENIQPVPEQVAPQSDRPLPEGVGPILYHVFPSSLGEFGRSCGYYHTSKAEATRDFLAAVEAMRNREFPEHDAVELREVKFEFGLTYRDRWICLLNQDSGELGYRVLRGWRKVEIKRNKGVETWSGKKYGDDKGGAA